MTTHLSEPDQSTMRTHAGNLKRSPLFRGIGLGLLIGICCLTASPLRAAEPYLQFLKGLKDRGYYNTALEYLDSLESDTTVPADILKQLPYERAQILIQGHVALVSLDEQRAQLNRAEAELDKFVKANPDHPLAGQANADRANLLLSRARVDIWDADAATESSSQRELQNRARGYLTQARERIKEATTRHEARVKSFPTFIPEADKARRAEREEAQGLLMQSQLDSAEISYWHARSQVAGSPERRKALEETAAEFEAVAQKYSQEAAGVYARLWQGKCYEELGDVGKALGLYDQILKHEDTQAVVQRMKDSALNFRLICLNHDQRKDYAVVVEEAEFWLKNNPDQASSVAGLGIQWQLCRALESLGKDRTRPETQRRSELSRAMDRARFISRYAGENKAQATRLLQRLTVELDRSGGIPRDFEGAYAAGAALVEEAGRTGDAYRAATNAGDAAKAAELMRSIRASGEEASRLFTAALKMKNDKVEPEKLATARLQLAYANFLRGRYLDCAVIADHQMRTYAVQSPDMAREAGFLAMSALEAAASASELSQDENDWMNEIGTVMISKWPESERSQEARILLGRSAWNRHDYKRASEWWMAIPEKASQYPTARISAGQAYWKRYAEASQLPEDQRPPAAELAELKKQAVDSLERGVVQRQNRLSPTAATPDDLVLGKLVLAQIRNLDGKYRSEAGKEGAIELLTRAPHDVVSAVSVAEGETRPTDGSKAKSARLASVAYQQLLRSYVGVRDLDAARGAREQLEKVAGSDNPQALTAVYVEFGRELQRELTQLKSLGENERANKTRQAFEDFLNDLANREEGQSFTSLLWIAETFAGLADDTLTSASANDTYYRKAADVYTRMLQLADQAGFLPAPAYRNVIRLNLSTNLRRLRDFPAAETSLMELLAENPAAPDIQSEAAALYEDWGRSLGKEGQGHLITSLAGKRTTPEVWGWSRIVQRLQREPASRKTELLNKMLLSAREHVASAELELARLMTSDVEKKRHLNLARHAVFSFIRSTPEYNDDDYARFNRVYGEILKELGQEIVPLPRTASALTSLPAESAGGASNGRPASAPAASGSAVKSGGAASQKPARKSGSPLMIPLIIVGGLAVAGGMVFYWYRQSSAKRRQRMQRLKAAQTPRSRT